MSVNSSTSTSPVHSPEPLVRDSSVSSITTQSVTSNPTSPQPVTDPPSLDEEPVPVPPTWEQFLLTLTEEMFNYQAPPTLPIFNVMRILAQYLPILLSRWKLKVVKYPNWDTIVEKELEVLGVTDESSKINREDWFKLMDALYPHFEFAIHDSTQPESSSQTTTASSVTSTATSTEDVDMERIRKYIETGPRMMTYHDFSLYVLPTPDMTVPKGTRGMTSAQSVQWLADNVPDSILPILGTLRYPSPSWYSQSLEQARASRLRPLRPNEEPFRLTGCFSLVVTTTGHANMTSERGGPHMILFQTQFCYADGNFHAVNFNIATRLSFTNPNKKRNKLRALELLSPQTLSQVGIVNKQALVIDNIEGSWLELLLFIEDFITKKDTDMPGPLETDSGTCAHPLMVHVLPDGNGMIVGICIETFGREELSGCRIRARGMNLRFELPYFNGAGERFKVWFLHFSKESTNPSVTSMTFTSQTKDAVITVVNPNTPSDPATSTAAASAVPTPVKGCAKFNLEVCGYGRPDSTTLFEAIPSTVGETIDLPVTKQNINDINIDGMNPINLSVAYPNLFTDQVTKVNILNNRTAIVATAYFEAALAGKPVASNKRKTEDVSATSTEAMTDSQVSKRPKTVKKAGSNVSNKRKSETVNTEPVDPVHETRSQAGPFTFLPSLSNQAMDIDYEAPMDTAPDLSAHPMNNYSASSPSPLTVPGSNTVSSDTPLATSLVKTVNDNNRSKSIEEYFNPEYFERQ